MASISTHILDLGAGHPAAGVQVHLECQEETRWIRLASGETDSDGRVKRFQSDAPLDLGVYRLHFEIEPYLSRDGGESFFPFAQLVFRVSGAEEHYHVPLLLNHFGYSTYRGS
ncbi:MAG: hydroxyisourate hydrolase [Myxococcota bacterium]|nr:hydroxyisourate hydrolase [Myxococcota bacterium]